MSNISSGRSNNTSCAACYYKRRKCAPDCILAPYFPPHSRRQFQTAHKLFGARNITKIIKNLSPSEKDMAVKTILFESDVRADYPVGGCYRMIKEIQRRIDYDQAELELVLRQLAECRAQEAQKQQEQEQESHLQMQESCDSSLSCEMVNHPDISNS